MEAYERKTGGRVMAIPHNGNLSNGLMFDDVTLTGRLPLDRAYADAACGTSPSTRSPRSRGTAKRTRRCLRLTSSPTSRPGTMAASAAAQIQRHVASRIRAGSTQARPRVRGEAWGQPVQARHDRLDGFAHVACDRRGKTISSARSLRSSRAPIRLVSTRPITGRFLRVNVASARPTRMASAGRPGGSLGEGEHARGAVGCVSRGRRCTRRRARALGVRVFAGYEFTVQDLDTLRLRPARV